MVSRVYEITYWLCARTVQCGAESVLCLLKLQLTFVPAYGLNFWSGLYDILVGIRPMSSKDVHCGWFLGRWFVVVNININRNRIPSHPIMPKWPNKLLNIHIFQLIMWLIIASRPNVKLYYVFCLVLPKQLIKSMPSDRVWFAHGKYNHWISILLL